MKYSDLQCGQISFLEHRLLLNESASFNANLKFFKFFAFFFKKSVDNV